MNSPSASCRKGDHRATARMGDRPMPQFASQQNIDRRPARCVQRHRHCRSLRGESYYDKCQDRPLPPRRFFCLGSASPSWVTSSHQPEGKYVRNGVKTHVPRNGRHVVGRSPLPRRRQGRSAVFIHMMQAQIRHTVTRNKAANGNIE